MELRKRKHSIDHNTTIRDSITGTMRRWSEWCAMACLVITTVVVGFIRPVDNGSTNIARRSRQPFAVSQDRGMTTMTITVTGVG
jgi:hypothetical protein